MPIDVLLARRVGLSALDSGAWRLISGIGQGLMTKRRFGTLDLNTEEFHR